MEFFEAPVHPEPPLSSSSNSISKVYLGRIKASSYFFRVKEARSNRKLWETLRLISDNYRTYMSQTIVVEVIEKDLQDARKKLDQLAHNLDDMVSKCAMTYTSLEDSRIKSDMIIKADKHLPPDIREKLVLNCKL